MLKARQRVYDAKKKQIFELSFDGELDEVREFLSVSLSLTLALSLTLSLSLFLSLSLSL